MAECAGEIVYQREGQQAADCAATDDSALIRSYDRAVRSYQDALQAGGKDQASERSEPSASSGSESEGDVEEEEEEEEKQEEGSKWKVGDACCAVWSEDGLLYPAHIVSLSKEGGSCTVEYEHYGNREDQRLQDLFPPDESPSLLAPRRTWKAGDACSAIWSEDGLLYPATVRLVDAVVGTCLVEFDGYGNKEEQALEELLPPCGAVEGNLGSWQAEEDAPEGRRPSSPRELPHRCRRQSTKAEWARYFPPPAKSGAWWPGPLVPFSPPPRRSTCPPVIPPPPPLLLDPLCGEDDTGGGLACVLLAWYMSGYHTGFYMGLRQGRAEAAPPAPKQGPGRKKSSPRS